MALTKTGRYLEVLFHASDGVGYARRMYFQEDFVTVDSQDVTDAGIMLTHLIVLDCKSAGYIVDADTATASKAGTV